MSERLHYFSPDASVPITFDTDSSDVESLDSGLPLAPAYYDSSRRPCSVSDRSSLHAAQLQLWCDEARRRRAPSGPQSPPNQQHPHHGNHFHHHNRRAEQSFTPPPRSASAKSLRIRITPSSSSLSLASDLDGQAPNSATAALPTPSAAASAAAATAVAAAAPGSSSSSLQGTSPAYPSSIQPANSNSSPLPLAAIPRPATVPHHIQHTQSQTPAQQQTAFPRSGTAQSIAAASPSLHGITPPASPANGPGNSHNPASVAAARVPLPYVPPTADEDTLTEVDSIPPSPPSRPVRSRGRIRALRWSSFLARRSR